MERTDEERGAECQRLYTAVTDARELLAEFLTEEIDWLSYVDEDVAESNYCDWAVDGNGVFIESFGLNSFRAFVAFEASELRHDDCGSFGDKIHAEFEVSLDDGHLKITLLKSEVGWQKENGELDTGDYLGDDDPFDPKNLQLSPEHLPPGYGLPEKPFNFDPEALRLRQPPGTE